MKDMQMKRAIVQSTLALIVSKNMQNTEGDYCKARTFVEHLVFSYYDEYKDCLFAEGQISTEARELLNPLWDYYFNNLHDGYNVD